MKPFQLFKFCQGAIGRRYRGTFEDFDRLDCASYYYGLSDFLKEKFGRNTLKHKEYIRVCESNFGARFDPFHLMSEDYFQSYKDWEGIHSDERTYRKHILKSIQDVYDFCREKEINNLKEYVQRWAVSHITSGVLDENVACVLKVHEAQLTKPEKRLIKKKFFNKLSEIEERLKREEDLRKFIEKNIRVVQTKINQSSRK